MTTENKNELDLIIDKTDEIIDNNTELTDEQIDSIVQVLKENRENNKKDDNVDDKSIPYNTLQKDGLISDYANVSIDNVTGERIIKPIEEKESREYKDILADYGLSEKDSIELLNIIMRYRKGEKFSIYNEMPDSIKLMIRNVAGTTNMNEIQQCSKIVLEQFCNSLEIDKEFDNLQEEISKELGSMNIMNIYDTNLRQIMEVDLINKAKEIQDKDEESALKIIKVSEAFTKSYTFEPLIEAFKNNEKCTRRLDKEVKKYKRYCDEFNYKYLNSKYTINNIQLVAHTLKRVLTDVEEECIMRFIVLFCRYTMNMNNEIPHEHVYMYYTIKNILSLDFLTETDEMYVEVKTNITKVIDLIIEKDKEELDRLKKLK